jgi:tetratricopeptide (TPR) repeat protein
LSFGFVAATALAGAPFALRYAPACRWICGAVLLHMTALLPVFITERYRLAAVPGLTVLAVVGLWCFWNFCVFRQVTRALAYAGLLAIAAFAVSAAPTDPALWALDPYNAGREAIEERNLTVARRKLELAYAYVPRNAELNLALGNLSLEEGNANKAREFYRATLSIEPRHKAALSNLGVLALQEQDWARAVRLFEASLEVQPGDDKAHYLMARALLGSGDPAHALTEVEAALRLKPTQPEYVALREQIRAGTDPALN